MSAGIRRGVAVSGLILVPIGVHVAMATQRGTVWAGMLIILEAALIAWIALSIGPARRFRWTGTGAVVVATTLVWWSSPDGIVAPSAMPHAIAYLSLLTVFGSSLASGRKPIVTIFAERSRGELPQSVARYTRRVTWAWCLFCVSQLLGSALLLLFAPLPVWSTFVNLCNLPLLVAMFCGEFAWRKWRHGSWPHEKLTDGFRMAGELRLMTTHDPV